MVSTHSIVVWYISCLASQAKHLSLSRNSILFWLLAVIFIPDNSQTRLSGTTCQGLIHSADFWYVFQNLVRDVSFKSYFSKISKFLQHKSSHHTQIKDNSTFCNCLTELKSIEFLQELWFSHGWVWKTISSGISSHVVHRVNQNFANTYHLHLHGGISRAKHQREGRYLSRLFQPWRWRRYFLRKRPVTFNRLDGAISYKTVLIIQFLLLALIDLSWYHAVNMTQHFSILLHRLTILFTGAVF